MKILLYYRNSNKYNYCIYIDTKDKIFDEYGTGNIMECNDTLYIRTNKKGLNEAKEKIKKLGFKRGYVVNYGPSILTEY